MVAPVLSCSTPNCPESGKALGQPKHYAGVLFTRERGILPVRIFTLYCRCKR